MPEASRYEDTPHRTCTSCGESLPLTKEYFQWRNDRGYFMKNCKSCKSKKTLDWQKRNPEKVRGYAKNFRENNPEKFNEIQAKSRKKNHEKRVAYNKDWRHKNRELWLQSKRANYDPEKAAEYYSQWYTEPRNVLRSRLRASVYQSCRQTPGDFWKYLDYTVDDLMESFERQFSESMSWANMDEWEIDHIKPVKKFQPMSVGDQKFQECFALENLQPLWTEDNRVKQAKEE